jgi:hypothetical protein
MRLILEARQKAATCMKETAACKRVAMAPLFVLHIKVKQSHNTCGGAGGDNYSSYSFTTSALGGGEWSASRLGRPLAPGKGSPVLIVQEAGWAPDPVWTQRLEETSLASAGDRTSIAPSSNPYPDTILTELARFFFSPYTW